ncbi:MAG: selenide, water dikinase SelD [bacterium]|nr:selenide, water dikinase SelD [bacterium]
MGPAELVELLGSGFSSKPDQNVVVGLSAFDDAGVIRSPSGDLLVQTVDFFTPIVDDPYIYGAAAAANALSDVYAMGGDPLSALTIACLPIQQLPTEVLKEIFLGAQDKLQEAGCELLGGHTVQDKELKFGFSVTGIVSESTLMMKSKGKEGDVLVLTKGIGTGILATAAKRGVLSKDAETILHQSLVHLNRQASVLAKQFEVRCATDVTGFGLIGHCLDIAKQSKVGITLYAEQIPILPHAYELAKDTKNRAGGLYRNRLFVESKIHINFHDDSLLSLLFDPQTSGGLLLSVPSDRVNQLVQTLLENHEVAAMIGELTGSEIQIKIIR